MKKVLLVFPGLRFHVDEGSKHRLNSFIKQYSQAGYKVTVLAFYKDHPKYLFQTNKYLHPDAKWILFPLIFPIYLNKYIARISALYVQLVTFLLSFRYDLIQSEFNGVACRFCKKNKCITDFHGDGYHENIENPDIKLWFLEWHLYQQKKSFQYTAQQIFVSENLRRQIELNTESKSEKYSIISCGIDLLPYEHAITPKELAQELEGRIIIGYSGGTQKWQNIQDIILLSKKLHSVDSRIFLLIYTNQSISAYEEELSHLGSNNYKILSLSSHDIPSYLQIFHIGLLLRDDLILNIVSSPTKICEYLAAGIPVVCTSSSGDYKRSVINYKTGYILDYKRGKAYIEDLYEFILNVITEKDMFAKRCREEALKRTFLSEFKHFISSF